MNLRYLWIILVLCGLSSQGFSSFKNSINFVQIPVAITENNITINFINAASTKKIILLFENDQVTQVDELHSKCMSQYDISTKIT